MTKHRVVFTPSGHRGEFEEGATLLAAARQLGVDLDSVCGGRGICGRCQVDVVEGEFAKHALTSRAAHVTSVGDAERRYFDKRGAPPAGRRLGCQARVCGDLVVDTPPESQVHRQVVRKSLTMSRPLVVDPMTHLRYVEVREPDLAEPTSDFRRLQIALAEQWGLAATRAGLPVLASLQAVLRAGDWKVTAAVRVGGEIVAVYPGLVERIYGVALDVGTTTLAAYLCDLVSGETLASAGRMNPQIRFGEDLMSRVSYTMMEADGAAKLIAAVREGADQLIGEAAEQAGVERSRIVEVTLAGNPIMHHLFLGLDPKEIGGAPFALTIDGGYDASAGECGLKLAPGARVYALPCIAGHVGADTTGVALALAPHRSDERILIADVGTNAEILYGNRQRLLACSSPTGPAFEGAQISCGQRAAPGAIERLRIDRATLEPRYKVIGCDLWSDEPGFEEATKATSVTGLCGSGIIETIAEMFLAGILASDGTILRKDSARIFEVGRSLGYRLREGEPELIIYQTDVRAIQLAKAALYAGAKLLIERFGAPPERIALAGAFGAHIDPAYAMALGLIPDADLDKVSACGNAAGAGALIALVEANARPEIEALARDIEKIETAIAPNFQDEFVAAMAFPHARDSFPNLAQRIALPEPSSGAARRRRR